MAIKGVRELFSWGVGGGANCCHGSASCVPLVRRSCPSQDCSLGFCLHLIKASFSMLDDSCGLSVSLVSIKFEQIEGAVNPTD